MITDYINQSRKISHNTIKSSIKTENGYFQPKISFQRQTATDSLYYYYLYESVFGTDYLTSFIYLLANAPEKYGLASPVAIESLSSCFKLPNVFSRQYFISYAFECIEKTHSYRDFWQEHSLEIRDNFAGNMLYFNRKLSKSFSIDKWLSQFSLFCNLLSDFVFPVFEWCFICMLFEQVESLEPNATHFDHLFKIQHILSTYINNNYQMLLPDG